MIARLTKGLALSRRTTLGVGDDCAILARPRHAQLLTIDSMVEGVHFKLSWGAPALIGARALAVNLSDIAAMGGVPRVCVVALAIAPSTPIRFVELMYRGLRECARVAGVDLAGGNVTRAKDMSITIALIGDSPRRPMLRSTALSGDAIYVTGTLGDAALGWRILDGELSAPLRARRELVRRFLQPDVRLDAARALVRRRTRVAAIDISDGLIQDLGHIAQASGVGAELDFAAIPVSPSYRAVAGQRMDYALGGGEDYELAFCTPPKRSDKALSRMMGVPVTRVGTIVARKGVWVSGGFVEPAGWDHLARR